MKKWSIVIVTIVILCGLGFLVWKLNEEKTPSVSEEKSSIPEKKPIPELKIVDEDSNTRPYAVMINNHDQARKYHTGLQDAYLVYEIIVEGGLTRMMAIFKDQNTSKVGSVRSSRHYFLDYALENDAIYVHFGWSPQAESDIRKLGVQNINGLYDNAFWRDNSLNVAYEHKAFTNIQNIKDMVERKQYRTTTEQKLLLNYKIEEVSLEQDINVTTANTISIPYSYYVNTSYAYDSEKKVYQRSVNGNAHIDAIITEQYTTKNIIIEQVSNYSIDNYGRQTLSNIGTGSGYYITGGYAIPITWKKDSRTSQTKYYKTLEDGTSSEILVNDGNTFIQIMPTTKVPIIT